jgi:hypothetical protein
MDSATITYLINSRRMSVPYSKDYDVSYKQRILELTAFLFDNKEELLQESFHTYVLDCIRFLKNKEQEEQEKQQEEKKEILPINGDQFIFSPKKIDVLLQKNKKKPKNIFLIHDKS